MTKGHVLVGGGTGFIGRGLTFLLRSCGYNVTVISRMPGAERITWMDITSCGIPKDVTAVVNLAGQNILEPFSRWTPGFKQNVWNSRINSNITLAKAINSAEKKPEVFVNISGVGIYPPDGITEYSEDLETPSSSCNQDFFERLVIEMEKAACLDTQDVRTATIRCGVVLSRSGGMIHSIYWPFFFFAGGFMGTGCQPLPWIHLKDICRLFVHIIENKQSKGIYNGVAPEIISHKDFAKELGCAMKRPYKFPNPEFLVNLLFGKERAILLLKGQKVKPKRALEENFEFEFDTIDKVAKAEAKISYDKKKPFPLD